MGKLGKKAKKTSSWLKQGVELSHTIKNNAGLARFDLRCWAGRIYLVRK